MATRKKTTPKSEPFKPEETVKQGPQAAAQKARGRKAASAAAPGGAEKPPAAPGAAAAPEKGAPAKATHGQSHKNHPVMLKQAAKHKAAREQAKHAPAGKKSGRK